MKLDAGQKLTLMMLCDVCEHLGIDNGLSPSIIQAAITTDNTWALDWEYAGILGIEPEPTPSYVSEVTDILDMWWFLEHRYKSLDDNDKQRLEELAGVFGRNVEFSGFDGNNETEHYSAAKFMINKLGRFESFKGRDLDSHSSSVEHNKRMLSVFLPLRPDLSERRLTVEEMAEILNARVHPSWKK